LLNLCFEKFENFQSGVATAPSGTFLGGLLTPAIKKNAKFKFKYPAKRIASFFNCREGWQTFGN
jgi:hypothetical protein